MGNCWNEQLKVERKTRQLRRPGRPLCGPAPWAESLSTQVLQDCLVGVFKEIEGDRVGPSWGNDTLTHLGLRVRDIH